MANTKTTRAKTTTTTRKNASKKAASKGGTTAKRATAKKSQTKKSTTRAASPKKKTPTKKGGAGSAKKPSPKRAAGDEVKVDRRKKEDRRKTTERRTKQEPVAVERRKIERRAKVNRRRQIDPTTCERDYTEAELEFMTALDEYKRTSGRMFPTCSEVLEVIRGLGYEKSSKSTDDGSPPQTPPEGVDSPSGAMDTSPIATGLAAQDETLCPEDLPPAEMTTATGSSSAPAIGSLKGPCYGRHHSPGSTVSS